MCGSTTCFPLFSDRVFARAALICTFVCGSLLLVSTAPRAAAQSSAIVYQGKLEEAGRPSTGTYDLLFTLFDAATLGSRVGSTITVTATPVTNGLFTVRLDFGATAFSGQNRWIEIGVRTNGLAAFTTLAPRQAVAAAPYAVTAFGLAGQLPTSQLTGQIPSAQLGGAYFNTVRFLSSSNTFNGIVSGNGANLTNLSAAAVTGTLVAGTIPNLDAAKLTSGTLADARLSGSIARLTDVANSVTAASNALSGRLIGTNDALVALINSLNASLVAQIAALNATVGALSNGTNVGGLSGSTFVSTDPSDPVLLARGLRQTLSVAAPAWRNGTGLAEPTARYEHTAVWTGQELVVWGGNLGAGVRAAGGARYRPDLDTWQAVSTVNAPLARSRHTAVWTGAEMMVWGGFSGSSHLDTGGRFSVANQLWNTITTTGAPAARDSHVAVWTGGRVVIWSGRNLTGILASGGLYDPTNNVWSSIVLPNEPTPRANAAAIWAGDRMLVWGGDGTNSNLATGGQLVFTNGAPTQWRTITLTGAPRARSGHTAVWTGSRMLVWGGALVGTLLGDGAAYDPLADVWTPISSINAPAARTLHHAVWTGSEMVIFGGETAGGTTATGGAFDPVSGKWRALDNPGSPHPRSLATTVWTGGEMLFFGGLADGAPLATLQRLPPQPTWYFFRKP